MWLIKKKGGEITDQEIFAKIKWDLKKKGMKNKTNEYP